MLLQAYRKSPFLNDMLEVVDSVMSIPLNSLADVSRASIVALANYFELTADCVFLDSEDLGVQGNSTRRLLNLTRRVGGSVYITGHGAKNYLEHELFDSAGIEVRYMQYEKLEYPQLYGEFPPYVTGLDLIANCGKKGREFISSGTVNWREFNI